MKKTFALILVLLVCLTLASCGSAGEKGTDTINEITEINEVNEVNEINEINDTQDGSAALTQDAGAPQDREDVSGTEADKKETNEEGLYNPETVWWSVGTTAEGNAVFAYEVKNSNDVPIEFTALVNYKKGGETVASCETVSCTCLAPGQSIILFDKTECPADTDGADIAYTAVHESAYTPVPVSFLKAQNNEDGSSYDFEVNPPEDGFTEMHVVLAFFDGGTLLGAEDITILPGEDLSRSVKLPAGTGCTFCEGLAYN